MSEQKIQRQNQDQIDVDQHNNQGYLKQNDQSNHKHSNEFLSESYDEYDKKNHCNIGIAKDNIDVNESREIDTQQQLEQERHVNQLIDHYNSQYEFYKPNKNSPQLNKDKSNKNESYNQRNKNLQSEHSPLQKSNHLQNNSNQNQSNNMSFSNKPYNNSQYNNVNSNDINSSHVSSNNAQANADKSIPITTVLAEEKQKNQYINQSGAANIQSFQNDDYEFCPNCNRKFFSGRLNLHLKSCKPNKPLKPVKKQSQPQQNNGQDTADSEKTQQNSTIYSSQTQNTSSVSFVKTADNFKADSLNDQDKSQLTPQQKQQKSTNKINKQNNTEQNDENNQSAGYNIEQFEHKIISYQNEQQGDDNRVECQICGRKFMSDRIQKHEVVCSKSQKARPVYNSSAARCPEDENGQKLIPKSNLLPPSGAKKISEMSVVPKKAVTPNNKTSQQVNESTPTYNPSIVSSQTKKVVSKSQNSTPMNQSKQSKNEDKRKKTPKWKLEHQQFIENIRYNKMVKKVEKEGGDVSKIEKPVDDLEALGYVNCQYCSRKFAKETAERHIPLCKNIINRPKPPRQPSRQRSEKMTSSVNQTSDKMTSSVNQNSEKMTQSVNQNSENKKPGVKKIVTKNNFSTDDSEPQMKYSISNTDSQQQTNDNSDQASLFSNKTLNTTGGYGSGSQKYNPKVSSAIFDKQTADNQKSRTGILPDIILKQQDKKYFTSRKFGSYNNRSNHVNNNNTSAIQTQKTYEDIYTRTTQIGQVSCPHCERVFAKNAADRHIPICKNIINRPNPLSDITRNTRLITIQIKIRQSLPKKMTTQQAVYTQRQSLGHNQQSPRSGDSNRIVIDASKIIIDGYNVQKPRTSDSQSYTKIINQVGSSKTNNFCGFCGFQFAMDHKYCGSCGKKRFSTANKTIPSNTMISSKTNFDNPNQ